VFTYSRPALQAETLLFEEIAVGTRLTIQRTSRLRLDYRRDMLADVNGRRVIRVLIGAFAVPAAILLDGL
jgi:hypothetical protein